MHRIPGSPRQALTFYLIALGLAALVALAAPWLGDARPLVTMLTPAAAAVVMLGLVAPEGGFRAALHRLGLTRAGLKGWPLAIGTPASIHAIGVAILAATGLAVLAAPDWTGPPAVTVAKFAVGLVFASLFGLAEEVGWRGYMLPRMGGFTALGAMLAVGLLHGVWHLPLLLGTDLYHRGGNPVLVVPLFLVTLTLAGVFYGFLRLWTGSVWPVAIAHGAVNTAWQVSGEFAQSGSALATEYVGGESGLIVIAGLRIFTAATVGRIRRGDLRF
jgi:membrane protease YdiL (CAAX protease family)